MKLLQNTVCPIFKTVKVVDTPTSLKNISLQPHKLSPKLKKHKNDVNFFKLLSFMLTALCKLQLYLTQFILRM